MADCPKLEADVLAEPAYATLWTDPKRKDDAVLLLTSLSQMEERTGADGSGSIDQPLFEALKRRNFIRMSGTTATGTFMELLGYEARKGAYPDDFTQHAKAFVSSVATEPYKGVWTPGKPLVSARDFSALAYMLSPEDGTLLREFMAAKKDGPFKWSDGKNPFRPYLSRERAALERLALISPLLSDEKSRLADLRASNYSDTYVEPVNLADLLGTYHQNEVKGDGLYQGHVVRVTGVLGSVKKDVTNSIYAIVGTGVYMETTELQCFFADRWATRIASLSKGERVTVTAKVKGLILLNVIGEDCELAD